jgi:hypothetical protein
VPPPVVPTPPVVKKATPQPKPLKCGKGFVKRKIHGKQRCVRVHHKAAKHKHRHKKSA